MDESETPANIMLHIADAYENTIPFKIVFIEETKIWQSQKYFSMWQISNE